MRPKLLEIEGLQSFREKQRINFESLGEVGIFGIFGPTGSGKSTVLDAITFALFGKVKRADRGTQGIINSGMEIAKVAFSFELLRDNERKTYRVERTYQRKKGSENSCEPKIARLIEVTSVGEIPLCDKASEVSSSIEELIGLNHEDFTRAVVLPQNSFQEFLFLDNSKKREMLERIFYLEEYGKQLSDKLSRKSTALKSRIDMLSGELQGYADATSEILMEAEKALESVLAERTRIEKEFKSLELKVNEAKEVWQHVQELSQVESQEKQHLSVSSVVEEKRMVLDHAMKADKLVDIIRRVKEASQKLEETSGQIIEIKEKLPDIAIRLEVERKQYEELKKEIAVNNPQMLERRARLVDALMIKNEIQRINEKENELKKTLTELEECISIKNASSVRVAKELEIQELQIAGLEEQITELKITPDYRQKIQEGSKLQNEVATASINLKELEKKASECSLAVLILEQKLSQIRGDMVLLQNKLDDFAKTKRNVEACMPETRQTIQKQIDTANAFQFIYDILKIKKNEINEINEKMNGHQMMYLEFVKELHILEQNKDVSSENMNRCRDAFDLKTKEINYNTSYLLSKNLIEGEPCPVCGSEHHPKPAVHTETADSKELVQQLEFLKQELTQAEADLKKAENELLVKTEQMKALSSQIEQEQKELETKTIAFENEKLKLPESYRLSDLEQVGYLLKQAYEAVLEKLIKFETYEKELEGCNLQILDTNNELGAIKIAENGIISELKAITESYIQAQEAYSKSTLEYNEKAQLYSNFLKEEKIESASGELNRIMENDRQTEAFQQQILKVREILDKYRTEQKELTIELQESSVQQIKIASEIDSLVKNKGEKEFKLNSLAGNAGIEEEINSINKRLDDYIQLEKNFSINIISLDKIHHELSAQRLALEMQHNAYKTSLEADETQMKTELKDKGFFDIEDAEKHMLSQDVQKELKKDLDEYDRMRINNQAQKDRILKKLNNRVITEDEWIQIENSYKELAVMKEETVARSEVAKNNVNIIKLKHEKWVELNKTYKEAANKYGLYEIIQKILRAERGKDNSFIDYIAQERLGYVAAKASETLGLMTKYKYALELDINSGFIIRDNVNGGIHRMVSSLSGGETFLVSLSLALALSEQIQLKGQSPLEFFFLDEGFGTLDNTLLDTVIDSLERLSSKQRVIGLISHVPELRSRISRRLIIDPPATSGNGSKVRIEKA